MNRTYAIMAALAFECVGLVTVSMWLGLQLDEKYGWNGLGAMGGAIVGVVGWFTHLFVVLRQLAKAEEKGDTKEQ
ncbi:MAG: hypothetical protein AAB250_07075 [Bdellovibrionota bacterium]